MERRICPSCEQGFYVFHLRENHFCSKCNQLTWKIRSEFVKKEIGHLIKPETAIAKGRHLVEVTKIGEITQRDGEKIVKCLGLPPWGIMDKGDVLILDDLFD